MKYSLHSTSLLPLVFAALNQGGLTRRTRIMLAAVILFPAELAAIQAESAPVAGPQSEVSLGSPTASRRGDEEILAARAALLANSDSEAAAQNLVEALARSGRKREAFAEAERFAEKHRIGASFRALRAFIRRDLNDLAGASADFTTALVGEGLNAEQRRNVEAGLGEVQAALAQIELNRAQGDLTNKEFTAAAEKAHLILIKDPVSEAAMLIRVDALARAGQQREALADADLFVIQAPANAMLRARRGFLRRELKDPKGATEDFTVALTSSGLTAEQRQNIEAGLLEARAAQSQDWLGRADAALKQKQYDVAADESLKALERDPHSVPAMSIRIEALSGAGRKRAAADAASQFIAADADAGGLRAQRGYLRRELNDYPGAIADFSAVLSGPGLSAERRRSLEAALTEARGSEKQSSYDRAQTALNKGDYRSASGIAEAILMREPDSEVAQKIRIEALSRSGRKADARAATDRLIARGQGSGWAYAERGFARREAGDLEGAVQDFDAALGKKDLNPAAIPNIRYARAEAVALQAEGAGDPLKAEASYRAFVETEPGHADGWFKLGYLLLAQKRPRQGADALNKGLELRPVATAYLDSANAYVLTNAPLASKNYREGLDRWYAGDSGLADRSKAELERVKNEVVEADASIRTNVSFGGIGGRPEGAGGTNNAGGVDTRVRFDGRYLPAIEGLEAFARGLTDKDATGARETSTGAGVRYRPLAGLNLYVGGMIDHSYQPKSETEFVALWGVGLGSDAYPYASGWRPYWDFGSFGAWHTSEGRILQDTRGNAGVLYELRAPVRAAVGPTVLAVASYDSQAATPWATGIGPSLLAYVWLGGDRYRSYDAIVTLQVGYLVNVGADQRQQGWRGQVGVTF